MEPTPQLTPEQNQAILLRLHRRNRMKKIAIGAAVAVAALCVVILGYFGTRNLGLFQAALVALPQQPAAKAGLYIPDYTGAPGDTGAVEVISQNAIQDGVFGLSFKLQYNPQQISFPSDPVSLAGTALSGAFVQTNVNVPGELNVMIVSADAKAVAANAKLASINTQISSSAPLGTEISLTPREVEVSVSENNNPVISHDITQIVAGKITITSSGQLRALYAEATDATHVQIYFSDFLRNLDSGHYTLVPALAVTSAQFGTDQRSIVLTTVAQTAGTLYRVALDNNTTQGNVQGNLDGNFSQVSFSGFQAAGVSAVKASAVEVVSATQIRVTFSGDVAAPTLTPVNFNLHSAATMGTANPALSVTNITVENTRTALLTTTRQQPNTNYFVVLNGVRDTTATTPPGGLPLGNARILNFVGFRAPAPVVTTVTPDNLPNNAEGTLTINGSNLSRVAVVRVGTTEARIGTQTDQQMTVTVPAGLVAGIYNLVLTNTEGEAVTVQGAVLISAPEQRMRVVSDESHAVPLRVPNDGTTRTTFWVLVEDPRDVANIERVTIDLTQIGGAPAQAMAPSNDNKTDRRQWFTFQTTVPATVATRNDPYVLPVTVKNRSQEGEASGTATIIVNRNVQQGIAPTIDQAYVSPVSVPPDGRTQARVSARVSDQDGIATVISVVADLGRVGGGFTALRTTAAPAGTVTGQLNTGWYVSDPFTVPATTPVGNYKIGLTVSDNTGATAVQDIDFSVSATLSGPSIDAAQSFIGPRNSVSKTGNATFSVNVFVSDPDTLADIASAIVNLRNVGGAPTPLTRDASSPETGRSGWYRADNLRVGSTSPLGVQTLEVIVTDKSGARANTMLQLDITEEDTSGDSPRVKSSKSYTTPRVAVNDGQTKITLYAFVSDGDDDVANVVVKLNTIGHVGAPAPQTLQRADQATASAEEDVQTGGQGASGAASAAQSVNSVITAGGSCPSVGNIVCMTPSVKEGSEGQWYVLPDVVIDTTTDASTTPYSVEVIATDRTGKTGRGTIPVSVNNGASYTNDKEPPRMMLAVATGATTIEAVFSEELDATTISSDGKEFTITDRNNIQQKLNVTAATINATGNIVTLTTEPQETGKYYVLSGSSRIRDAVGVPMVAGGTNRVSLIGFEGRNTPPVVEYIAPVDESTIEADFRDYLRPSSLVLTPNQPETGVSQDQLRPRFRGAQNFNVEVYESGGTSAAVPVRGVQFGDDANILIISTDPLAAGKTYRVNFKNLASYDGVTPLRSINKMVKGAKTAAEKAAGPLSNRADFNGDGKVDFLDFTMFAAVYGQGTAGLPAPAPAAGSAPQPIPPTPDSLAPHTSAPATPAAAH